MSSADPEFTISRVFDAPRDLVWKAWTDPALLTQWFGPKGTATKVLTFDLRPDGVAHSRMDTPEGRRMWAKFVYRDVAAPSRLVWVHSFSDEQANVVASPFGGPWPLELLTTVLFADEGDGTKVTVIWVPLDATEDERKAFAENLQSMTMGWTGTFDRLDAFLSKAR